MLNFFKKMTQTKPDEKDPYLTAIDSLFEKTDSSENLIKALTPHINEIDAKFKPEDSEKAEKMLRYIIIKLFSHLVKVGIVDNDFESYLNETYTNYLDFLNKEEFSEGTNKIILQNFINEFVSNDYFMQDFFNKLFKNIKLDNDVIEEILKQRLAEIIEQQADAYLTNSQFSLIKNERQRLVEIILHTYLENDETEKYINLASHELHGMEDYIRLINFLVSKNIPDEAVAFCYEGIEKDPDNQGIYFEKMAEIYETQHQFEKAFAFRVKSLYMTNNKDIYFKIKQAYAEHPESKEYNAKIINFLREHHQNNLLLEIFLEEKRLEDALEIAILPDIKIEEKLWVAEYTKTEFPEETLSLYKDIINYYVEHQDDPNFAKMLINCFLQMKRLFINLNRNSDWEHYLESKKTKLSQSTIQEIETTE